MCEEKALTFVLRPMEACQNDVMCEDQSAMNGENAFIFALRSLPVLPALSFVEGSLSKDASLCGPWESAIG